MAERDQKSATKIDFLTEQEDDPKLRKDTESIEQKMNQNSNYMDNKSRSTSHSNIFSAVSTASSRNSAHFVPGNRFWIERKIQQRNRRQDEQKRASQENEKYFA